MNKSNKGFTIVEALASAVLIGVGLTAAMGALSSMSGTEIRMRESEKMNRLAQQKLEEVIAVGNAANASTDGTFEDYGEPSYEWALEVQPSGIENLDTLRVVVTKAGATVNAPEAKSVGMLFTAPEPEASL